MTKKMNAREYFDTYATGWVVRNLRDYGNAVVPKELIEESGLERKTIERLLSMIIEQQVVIIEEHKGQYRVEV